MRCTHKINEAIMQVPQVLSMLQDITLAAIQNENSDTNLRNVAIGSMCTLVRTTGSVSHLLNLLKALLVVKNLTLDDEASNSAQRLANTLLDRFYENAAFLLAEEDTLAVGDSLTISSSNKDENITAMETLQFKSGVKLSLESSTGQVLSVTENGIVVAPRTRNLGPNEMFTVKECEDGWAFETIQKKLLGLGSPTEILDEKTGDGDEQEEKVSTSHVIARATETITNKETWSVVREGQYVLLRGQNEHYVTIGSIGGMIGCDAVHRAQGTKFRVLLRTNSNESFKT